MGMYGFFAIEHSSVTYPKLLLVMEAKDSVFTNRRVLGVKLKENV